MKISAGKRCKNVTENRGISSIPSRYHQMIKKDPRDPSLHNNMGIVYFSLQEYMPAYREFKLAQSINPENITYKQNMADALCHLEQFSESIELYKQIVEKTPTDDLSWNFLWACISPAA